MTPGTGFLLYAGYGVLVIGAVMFLYNGYKALRSPFGKRMYRLTWVLLALYPLGVACKGIAFGPLFFRYHLSDIGFPVFVATVLFRHFRMSFEKGNATLGHNDMADLAQWLRQYRVALIIGLVVSYSYEGFCGLLWHLKPDVMAEAGLIGDFDWDDIANYTLGAAVCYWLLTVWRRRVVVAKMLQPKLDATVEAAIEAERHSQRPQRQRGRRKPSNKPAGRTTRKGKRR